MIYLVRHAESVGNAGGRTKSLMENPLSDLGKKQAEEFACKINKRPDMIVVSPFIRTQQTAEPLMKKYPDVPVEVWPIQEFTCLTVKMCKNTTQEERKFLLQEYLEKDDPDFVHGEGAESFNQFLGRAEEMLRRCRLINQDKFVVIFTHGHFMKACKVKLQGEIPSIQKLRQMEQIENTGIMEI